MKITSDIRLSIEHLCEKVNSNLSAPVNSNDLAIALYSQSVRRAVEDAVRFIQVNALQSEENPCTAKI